MALEKKLLAIPPISLTANGTTLGVVTVADNVNFKDKQFIYLKSNTVPETQYQIKQVISSTQFIVGPRTGGITIGNYSDISQFLVSDNAIVGAPEQDKPSIPPDQQHYFAIYESSPVNADRIVPVDPYGKMYGPSNPLPIIVDGTITASDVNIFNSDGSAITTTKPLPVQLSDGSINVQTLNAELRVQLSSQDNDPVSGDVHSSVRIGDEHYEAAITSNNELQVYDEITHNDLNQIETDLVQIDTDLNSFKNANHSDLTQIDTDLNSFKASNHTDLVQIDTDLNSFKNVNHTDLTTINTTVSTFESANHTDLTTLDTDLNSFKNANHTDLTTINATVSSFETANHTDLTTINATVSSFETANHTDLTQIDTDLNTFKSANHTDLTKLDTDLNTFASTNNSNLTTINTTISSFETANHTDLSQIDSDIKAVQGSVSPGTIATKSSLMGAEYSGTLPNVASGQQVALQTDQKGRLITRNHLYPGTLDVFGTQTVAPKQLQIDIQFFNGILSSLVGLTTSGSGVGAMSNGAAQFSTGTSITGQCTGISTDNVAYASGCEVFAHFTAAFTTPTSSSSYQKIGLYNSLNGYYVGYIGTQFGIAIRNNGTDTVIYQSNWNMDTLTGVVGSQFTYNGTPQAINFTNSNIYRIRFGWLGSAPIYFEAMSPDGIWVTFHQVKQPNSTVYPSIRNPNIPITVDVSKTAADSTNLIISTACWGAGITFATNILEDPQTYKPINIDPRNELRTANSIMLIGAVQSGTIFDYNMWSTTLIGSGSNTLSGGIDILSTGATANSSSILNSINRARFIPGTVNAFYAGIRIGDTGVANNIRRWGAYDSSDGVYFQLNGTTPGIGIRSNGSDTVVTNFNGPAAFVLDTSFHTYEIQYTSGSAYFYQNGNLIHTYNSSTTGLSYTPHYKLGFESTNSGGGTNNAFLYIRGSSILRYGEANARPRYFHPVYSSRVQSVGVATSGTTGNLTANIKPTTAGNLLVVAATVLNNTLTITDSASQSYLTATSSTDTHSNLYIFYVQNTISGVTSVTITAPANEQMSLIVSEYSNIATSSALDQVSNHYNAGVTSWTTNSTPSTIQTNELLVGAASDIQHSNTNFVSGTGWNGITTTHTSGGGGNISGFFEEQYVTSIGTYAATGTNSQTANTLTAISSFKIINNSLSTGFTVPNTPTTIAIGSGTFRKLIINTLGTGSANITFYDNTTNSGNIIAVISLTSQIGPINYDLDFSNGLTMVVNTNTGDFTIIYD